MEKRIKEILATVVFIMMLSFALGWICSYIYYNPEEMGTNTHSPLRIHRVYTAEGWKDYGTVIKKGEVVWERLNWLEWTGMKDIREVGGTTFTEPNSVPGMESSVATSGKTQ